MTDEKNVYFLTSNAPIAKKAFKELKAQYKGYEWSYFNMSNSRDISKFKNSKLHGSLILSFLNPYILTSNEIKKSKYALNFHPALPKYPGRDPQHFSKYNQEDVIGATLHKIIASVDSGPIIDVIEKRIDPKTNVAQIDSICSKLAYQLLLKNAQNILDGKIKTNEQLKWAHKNKKTRRDFIKMSKISPDMEKEEVDRRIEAFHVKEYKNKVHVEIQGRYFTFDEDFEKEIKSK